MAGTHKAYYITGWFLLPCTDTGICLYTCLNIVSGVIFWSMHHCACKFDSARESERSRALQDDHQPLSSRYVVLYKIARFTMKRVTSMTWYAHQSWASPIQYIAMFTGLASGKIKGGWSGYFLNGNC